MTDSRAAIRRLVEGFARRLPELMGPSANETTIRLEFIDPFWAALGWDVQNVRQRSSAEKDVVAETVVGTYEGTRLRARRPDYFFRTGGFPRFIVEAKKPSVELADDRASIFQAKTYAWSARMPFAILTNFKRLRLFDCTLKPMIDDPERGMVREFDIGFADYEAQWDVLTDTFGRAAVEGGSLERLLAKVKSVSPKRRIRAPDRMLIDLRGSEQVDQAFLAFLEDFRRRFATAIYRDNRSLFPEAGTAHGAARLTEAVQRIINRFVFIRVCEDRGISQWAELRDTLTRAAQEGQDVYRAFVATFREFDDRFNGYLFKPDFADQLQVSGELLSDFIRSLYMPESPYRFDAISDDILGIIYERFLGSTVALKKSQVEVEPKPEVRHAGGVYYTPRFVVDSIVRRVVGAKVSDLSPAEVLRVKVLDPACGSGTFLVAAYQFLVEHCEAHVAAHPESAVVPATGRARKATKRVAFKDAFGRWHLSPEFKSELLASCIYGVDIDHQAMEVTVMSLYLKMLEGELPPNWQHELLRNRLLPTLDNNVRCGNSLIAPGDFQEWWDLHHGGLFGGDKELDFRVNRFDWSSRTQGFGRVLGDGGGFDCIIGNPPYIRVQQLNETSPEECEYYKWKYETARAGNFDIYVVFVEVGLHLLAAGGLLGFILPHKFWQASYGAGLRRIVADGRHLRSVVDFGHQQVFADATTYTAIHVLQRERNPDGVDYARFDDLVDGHRQCTALDAGLTPDGTTRTRAACPGDDAWSFVDAARSVALRMRGASEQVLGGYARLAQGLKTSCDAVYVLDVLERRDGGLVRVRSAQTEMEHEIESCVLRPLIKSENMRRFEIVPATRALLFPYDVRPDGHSLITGAQFESRAPRAWHYLNLVASVLRGRERGRMQSREDWWAYIYPKNFGVLGQPKLVIPDMGERVRVAFDESGEFIFSGGAAGGNAIVASDIASMWYLLGLLNSRVVEAYLREVGTRFRGGWLNCEIRFLRGIPVPNLATSEHRRTAKRIGSLAASVVASKAQLRASGLSSRDRDAIERAVESTERQIDAAAAPLYGLDSAEFEHIASS